MTTPENQPITSETFKIMAELAGLGMTQQELDELKPLYDLHAEYANQLHSIDFGAEEIALTFEPEWPS